MDQVRNTDSQLGLSESPHWYAVIRLNNERSLFKVPIVEGDKQWIDTVGSFVSDALGRFYGAMRDGSAKLEWEDFLYNTTGYFDNYVRKIVVLSQVGDPLCTCVAVIDFSRTSLPQLSGKAARDAFAMGHCLGKWEEIVKNAPECHEPYLGFSAHGLVYDGKPWQKPGDVAEQYYAQLREEHPLVIFWRNKAMGQCIVHPDYAAKT